jgi:hypothetical protein
VELKITIYKVQDSVKPSVFKFASLNGLEMNDGPMVLKMPPLFLQGPQEYYNVQLRMEESNGSVAKSGMRILKVCLERFD